MTSQNLANSGVANGSRRLASAVVTVEELVADDALLVRYVDARKRQTVEGAASRLFSVVRGDQGVEDAELPDDRRVGVREEVVGYAILVREGLELLLGVIADAVDAYALLFEEVQIVLQLDQLRAAVRSPDGRAEEDDDRLRVATIGVEVDESSFLVREREHREAFAHFWSGGELVRIGIATHRVTCGGLDRDPEVVGQRPRLEFFMGGPHGFAGLGLRRGRGHRQPRKSQQKGHTFHSLTLQ